MVCLPEEPELVHFGEDHEGVPAPLTSGLVTSTPLQMSSTVGGYVTLKRPYLPVTASGQQRKLHSDVAAHISSSPSPPTASSESSAISSAGSSVSKDKTQTGD